MTKLIDLGICIIIASIVIPSVFYLLRKALENKCRYYKKCAHYCDESDACTKSAGDYYGPGRKAGCYHEMKKLNNG